MGIKGSFVRGLSAEDVVENYIKDKKSRVWPKVANPSTTSELLSWSFDRRRGKKKKKDQLFLNLPKKGFLLKYSSCIMRKRSAVPAGEPGSCVTRCSFSLVAERQRLPGAAPFSLGLSHLLQVPGRKHGAVVSAVAGLRGREMYLRCLADLRGRERDGEESIHH